MKPKEWLLKNGHIKEITRGRLSKESIALIENAVRNGVIIEGYAVSNTQPKAIEKEMVKVEKVSIASDRVADVPDETRDERMLSAFSTDRDGNRVKVGMRTVCNACGSSLTYCPCPSPRVWVDSNTEGVVEFKSKTVRAKSRG